MLSSFLTASLVSIVNARSGGGDNIFDFELCPAQFAFAFESGRKCCSERPDWSQKFCRGDAVTCDSTRCEDQHSCDFVDAFLIQNLSKDYDGIYEDTDLLEANRPIFQGIYNTEGKCFWWNHRTRHWLLGQCKNVGENIAYAYIQEDLRCPPEYDGQNVPITWRGGGSGQIIYGVKMSTQFNRPQANYVAFKLSDTSSSVGVRVVKQEMKRYQQNCKFTYRRGRFICLRKRN